MHRGSFVGAPLGATRHRISPDLDTIGEAIERALTSLQSQRNGLSERTADATAAAAFAAGNDLDEHQTREADETTLLQRWEAELILAGKRLQVIDQNISHLDSFQIAFLQSSPTTPILHGIARRPEGRKLRLCHAEGFGYALAPPPHLGRCHSNHLAIRRATTP